jgi:hypothetical protein
VDDVPAGHVVITYAKVRNPHPAIEGGCARPAGRAGTGR